MIARYCIPFVAIFFVAAEPPAKTDLDSLQGEWALVTQLPVPIGVDGGTFGKLTITRNQWSTIFEGGFVGPTLTIRLNSNASPKEINMRNSEKNLNDGSIGRGIYKLEGNSLTVCFPINSNQERPKEFKGSDKVVVQVFKRVAKN